MKNKISITVLCGLMIAATLPTTISANDTFQFRTHGSMLLRNSGSGFAMDLDISFGGCWRFIMARMILRWEYEEPAHLADFQFALSGHFSLKKHHLFGGLQAGKRIFQMGYSWKQWLYGFHAGYEYRISKIFSLGAEYRFNAIEGSSVRDNIIVIIPAFYF